MACSIDILCAWLSCSAIWATAFHWTSKYFPIKIPSIAKTAAAALTTRHIVLASRSRHRLLVRSIPTPVNTPIPIAMKPAVRPVHWLYLRQSTRSHRCPRVHQMELLKRSLRNHSLSSDFRLLPMVIRVLLESISNLQHFFLCKRRAEEL